MESKVVQKHGHHFPTDLNRLPVQPEDRKLIILRVTCPIMGSRAPKWPFPRWEVTNEPVMFFARVLTVTFRAIWGWDDRANKWGPGGVLIISRV